MAAGAEDAVAGVRGHPGARSQALRAPLLNARAMERAAGDAVHAHVVAKFGLELNARLPKLSGPHCEEAIHMFYRMLQMKGQSSVPSETRFVLFPPVYSFPFA